MSRVNNPLSGLDASAVFQRLVEAGEEWADADAAASLWERTKDTVLAQLTLDRSGSRSIAAAEREAMASKTYQDHIRNMVLSRRDALKKKVRYDSAVMWARLLQSQNANAREEMKMGSMVP